MKTADQQDVHFYTAFIVIFVFGRGSKQQLDTQASSEHRWSFMGASWRPPGDILGCSWEPSGASKCAFLYRFYKHFRFWTLLVMLSCKHWPLMLCERLLEASWEPSGCFLGASWGASGEHLGLQNVHFLCPVDIGLRGVPLFKNPTS